MIKIKRGFDFNPLIKHRNIANILISYLSHTCKYDTFVYLMSPNFVSGSCIANFSTIYYTSEDMQPVSVKFKVANIRIRR